jgi:hypothetical protein
MTKEEFKKEMTWFLEFYDKKLNQIQTKIWFEFFEEFSVSKFNSLLKKHINSDESPFFPAIGKVLNRDGKTIDDLYGKNS